MARLFLMIGTVYFGFICRPRSDGERQRLTRTFVSPAPANAQASAVLAAPLDISCRSNCCYWCLLLAL